MKLSNYLFTTVSFFCFVPSQLVHADITTDGSVGAVSALNGPNFHIEANLGTIKGTNLFHSFEHFSLNNGESATFTGPANISHVINRVTGGLPSTINGSLQDNFAQADFYFINPAGIVFGANANLNISGSFFISTADYIRLSDGNHFIASSPVDGVTLTAAPPQAFGFMDADIASISIEESTLSISENQHLAIIGGDIIVSNSTINAPQSNIQLISSASSGEIIVTDNRLDSEQLTEFGEIQAIQSQWDTAGTSSAGDITIRAGRFVLENSFVLSYTVGSGNAGDIDINSNTIDINSSSVLSTETFGTGNSGAVTLNSDEITLADGSVIFAGTYGPGNASTVTFTSESITLANNSAIVTETYESGNAGAVTFNSELITLTNNSAIVTDTYGSGNAGAIALNSEIITLTNDSSIFAETFSQGNAGTVALHSDLISISNGSGIFTRTQAQGNAGDVNLKGNSITVSGESADDPDTVSSIQTSSQVGSLGSSGHIIIEASDLALIDGGELRTQSSSDANAGNIQLQLNNSLLIQGVTSTGKTSRMIASAGNREITNIAANGGDINIATNTMTVTDGGLVLSRSYGSGSGGTITVNASGDVIIAGTNQNIDRLQSTIIGSEANIQGGSGDAGNIIISAQNLFIMDGAFIRADAFDQGNTGDIQIELSESLIMKGLGEVNNNYFNSFISSNTVDGTGGDLTIAANEIQLIDSAQIQTVTFGEGNAGDMRINTTGELFISKENPFTGSLSGLYSIGYSDEFTQSSGQSGDISIAAGDLTISNGGAIWSNAFGTGTGGNIQIDVEGALEITGNASTQIPDINIAGQGGQISSSTALGGAAGHIIINTQDLTLKDGGRLYSTTFGSGRAGDIRVTANHITLSGFDKSIGSNSSGIVAESFNGSGDGGNINLTAEKLLIDDKGTISSSSVSNGLAGNIIINASDQITLQSDASISAMAQQSDGGNVTVNAISKLILKDSQITTSVGEGQGNGGNISIDPEFVILDNSTIRANAFGGSGGNISIVAEHFINSPNSIVEAVAKAAPGIDGNVVIDSPDRDISGKLSRPQLAFFNTQTVLSGHCSQPTSNSLIKLKMTPPKTLFTRIPQALRILDVQRDHGTLTHKVADKNFLDDALLHNEIFCLSTP